MQALQVLPKEPPLWTTGPTRVWHCRNGHWASNTLRDERSGKSVWSGQSMKQYSIRCICPGSAIPSYFTVAVSSLCHGKLRIIIEPISGSIMSVKRVNHVICENGVCCMCSTNVSYYYIICITNYWGNWIFNDSSAIFCLKSHTNLPKLSLVPLHLTWLSLSFAVKKAELKKVR